MTQPPGGWPPPRPHPPPPGAAPPGHPLPQYPGPPPYPGAPYPYPPPRQGTDGFAIAALVLGILGFFWVTPVLAIIFGIVALGRTKRSGQSGRGMAIVGIVLGVLWLLVLATIIVFAVTTSASRDPGGTVVDAGRVSATDLQVGDCVTDPPGGLTTTVVSGFDGVPCSAPHRGEVFAVFDLPDGPYPGAAEVDRLVEEGCNDRLFGYSPSAVTDPDVQLSTVFPIERGWNLGDREVVCFTRTDLPTTGSMAGR